MKNERQTQLLQIISEESIETQEQLLERLQARGIKSTQATISRDIKQLHLVKQHIIHAVVFDLLLQVRIEHIGITVLLVFISIKCNLNNVAFLYSF